MSTTEAAKPVRKARTRTAHTVNLTPTEAKIVASILASKADELQKSDTLEANAVWEILAAVLEKLK